MHKGSYQSSSMSLGIRQNAIHKQTCWNTKIVNSDTSSHIRRSLKASSRDFVVDIIKKRRTNITVASVPLLRQKNDKRWQRLTRNSLFKYYKISFRK